jgi:glyoxylase-like metal-dependent hydrolase (beta-lactamase superfamily II)
MRPQRSRIAVGLGLIGALATVSTHAAALETQRITDKVYALVGELGQRSSTNFGNNATFGVIITSAGVVLLDPGGSFEGARQVEQAIARITDKPVVLVINTGGQDHRWLGNGYFKAKGARLLASRAAVTDQRARATDQYNALAQLIGEKALAGTEAVHADETFDTRHTLTLGDTRLELHHAGAAHTPGDTIVWLPAERIAFAGDIVYVERMLGVGTMSNSRSWVKAFEALRALNPRMVVPGHGHAVPLATATADTYDYLVFLRQAVRAHIDAGRGIEAIGSIDQSRFARLQAYAELKDRNAQQVFQEMEWE